MIFAALVGAITWNLVTWWFGLPSSSSHALIGGVVGAALAAAGTRRGRRSQGLVDKVIIPGLVAPVLAFVVGGHRDPRRLRRRRAAAARARWRAASASASSSRSSLFALAHGTNDAQKTMGVITLALIANGNLPADSFEVPTWVIVSSATAIALGTYSGGWRIIQHDGHADHQDGPGAGLRGPGRRRGGPLQRDGARLPALDDARDLRRGHGRRRREERLGRALGHRRATSSPPGC